MPAVSADTAARTSKLENVIVVACCTLQSRLHLNHLYPLDPGSHDATAPANEVVAARRPQQHFLIASAAGDMQLPAGVPAWRGVLANLLAGATAGCAVEAGGHSLLGLT